MDNLEKCYIDRVKKMDYVEEVKNRDRHKNLTVFMNEGSLLFDLKGRLKYLPLNVHVNDNSLATTFYLKDTNDILGVRVTMDAYIYKAMNVILRGETVLNPMNVDQGYIIMIWQAMMYRILIKLTQ